MMTSGNLLRKTIIKTTLRMVEKEMEVVVECLTLIMKMESKELEEKQTWPTEETTMMVALLT